MQESNIYGIIITILSLAVTIALAMHGLKENGFYLQIIMQPAPGYSAPVPQGDPETGKSNKLKKAAKLAFAAGG